MFINIFYAVNFKLYHHLTVINPPNPSEIIGTGSSPRGNPVN